MSSGATVSSDPRVSSDAEVSPDDEHDTGSPYVRWLRETGNPIPEEIGLLKPGGEQEKEWLRRAREIFESMPRATMQPLPREDAFDLSKYRNQLGCTPAEAWQKCADVMRKYDTESCKAYREEIDTLVVFAGLFSAVVTAFTIESYQWLQADPNDAIIALLSQIAHPGNETLRSLAPEGLPDALAARINAYWFLALALSLAAALVAILCKQWVREFERHADHSHEQYISVRQTKLEGFERWGVPFVVAAVPLLLQSALGMFALGLVELLWRLHTLVAVIVLIPTLAALSFYATTTLLPGLQAITSPFRVLRTLSQCPYKSPQSLIVLRALGWLRGLISSWDLLNPGLDLVQSSAIFCHKKCLVFFRRVHLVLEPDASIWAFPAVDTTDEESYESTARDPALHGRSHYVWQLPRSLWRRLVRPWQRAEGLFYDPSFDLPTWSAAFGWVREQESDILSSLDLLESPSYPSPDHMRSWLALDLEFTSQRDNGSYSISEYQYHMRGGAKVPAMSPFRGLYWLLGQRNHPGLRQWIWLTVWDLVVPDSRWPADFNFSRRCHGVIHLASAQPSDTPGHPKLTDVKYPDCLRPSGLALAYALHAEIDPAVTGELLVNLINSIDIPSDLAGLVLSHSSDPKIWRSCLHAMLAHAFLGLPNGEYYRTILDHGIKYQPGRSLSPQETACIISLHLRDLLSPYGKGVRDGLNLRLVDVALDCLVVPDGGPSTADLSETVNTAFSLLAVAFDRWLEQRDAEDVSSILPSMLLSERGQRLYLDLLSSQLDEGLARAEARLLRQINHHKIRCMAEMRQRGLQGGRYCSQYGRADVNYTR